MVGSPCGLDPTLISSVQLAYITQPGYLLFKVIRDTRTNSARGLSSDQFKSKGVAIGDDATGANHFVQQSDYCHERVVNLLP